MKLLRDLPTKVRGSNRLARIFNHHMPLIEEALTPLIQKGKPLVLQSSKISAEAKKALPVLRLDGVVMPMDRLFFDVRGSALCATFTIIEKNPSGNALYFTQTQTLWAIGDSAFRGWDRMNECWDEAWIQKIHTEANELESRARSLWSMIAPFTS